MRGVMKRCKSLPCKVMFALVLLLTAGTVGAVTGYVSPDGSDENPGTRERPLATAVAARDAARRLQSSGVTVEFADGLYRLGNPIELDARDARTVWRAAHRGKAVLRGSVKPKARGWVSDSDVLALLPAAARNKVVFAELPDGIKLPGFRGGGCGTPQQLCESPLSVFQGEMRLEPARWPNEGFARTGENVGKAVASHDANF